MNYVSTQILGKQICSVLSDRHTRVQRHDLEPFLSVSPYLIEVLSTTALFFLLRSKNLDQWFWIGLWLAYRVLYEGQDQLRSKALTVLLAIIEKEAALKEDLSPLFLQILEKNIARSA